MAKKNTVMLIIMDGFGLSEKKEYNAVAQANLKVLPKLMQIYPHSYLEASAEAVVNIITVPYGQNRLRRRDIVCFSAHGCNSFFIVRIAGSTWKVNLSAVQSGETA